jgi:hypothetical protein
LTGECFNTPSNREPLGKYRGLSSSNNPEKDIQPLKMFPLNLLHVIKRLDSKNTKKEKKILKIIKHIK